MADMTLLGRHPGPMTVADLDELPDDGRRFELIDGMLFVTPAPSFRHQLVVGEVYDLLKAACPRDLVVMLSPFDVRLDAVTNLQPDVLVAPFSAFTEANLPAAPALAVEVLSPSTRLYDLNTKRVEYEAAGCASYWVIDPEPPALTAWDLVEGNYLQVAHVRGEETWEATEPYPVTVSSAALVRD